MTAQLKVVVFIVASVGIAWASRRPLRDYRSHGFYRFFAWEAILALMLINLEYWFHDPFRIRQLVSWLLLIVAGFLPIHTFRLFRRVGKPDSNRVDPSLYGIERTTELVTVGAYRYIRHPMYCSLLALAWGVFCKHVTWGTLCLAGVATFFLIMTARKEEAENRSFFGDQYDAYMKRTRMFVPFVF